MKRETPEKIRRKGVSPMAHIDMVEPTEVVGEGSASAGAEKVYIVLSQTGTILSRILKFFTKAPYNHSSIALSEDLATMYSFGRLNPYNPFIGGFVEESPSAGTFKRFKNTKVMVLEFEVSHEARDDLYRLIAEMLSARAQYHYNYLGLLLAAVRVHREKTDCYYCSEFVKAMAERLGLDGVEEIPLIVKPIHFLGLKHRTVYVGKLQEYRPPRNRRKVMQA